MLNNSNEEDISGKEFKNTRNFILDKYCTFLELYIIPEIIAAYTTNFFVVIPCRKQLLQKTIVQHLICLI